MFFSFTAKSDMKIRLCECLNGLFLSNLMLVETKKNDYLLNEKLILNNKKARDSFNFKLNK